MFRSPSLSRSASRYSVAALWRWALRVDPADPVAFAGFYQRVWQLFFGEYLVVTAAYLLGAPVLGLLGMIVVEGLKPTLVGVVLGLGLAAALVRVMSTLLFGVLSALTFWQQLGKLIG